MQTGSSPHLRQRTVENNLLLPLFPRLFHQLVHRGHELPRWVVQSPNDVPSSIIVIPNVDDEIILGGIGRGGRFDQGGEVLSLMCQSGVSGMD